MSRTFSPEFLQQQAPRSIENDEYSNLPLAKSTVGVRLPEIYHEKIKEKGSAWIRTVLCKMIDLEDAVEDVEVEDIEDIEDEDVEDEDVEEEWDVD